MQCLVKSILTVDFHNNALRLRNIKLILIMKKAGALTILTTIFLGLLSWGASQIINNKTDLATVSTQVESLKEKNEYDRKLWKEVRDDVKTLLQRK